MPAGGPTRASWSRMRSARSASRRSGRKQALLRRRLPAAAERLHQVDAERQAALAVANEGELGVVGGALGVEHLEEGRVAGLVAHVGELERVARGLEPLHEVRF